MKIATTLAALLLLAPAALFGAAFEGKVTMTMSQGKEGKMPMTFSLKSGLSRIDVQMEEMTSSMITNPAKQEVVILMPQQKMYMVQPIPKPTEAAEASMKDDTTVEKTGTTEKILGYDATKYLVKSRGTETEVWLTDQLGTFMGTGSGGPGAPGGRGGRVQAWEKAFQGKEAFPLRVVGKNKKGKVEFQMEATAIERQSLPDSLFVPPADYQKFDLGGMMRGLGMPNIPGMPGRPKQDN